MVDGLTCQVKRRRMVAVKILLLPMVVQLVVLVLLVLQLVV